LKAGFPVDASENSNTLENIPLNDDLASSEGLNMLGNDISPQEYATFDDNIAVRAINGENLDLITAVFNEYKQEDKDIVVSENQEEEEDSEDWMVEEEYCPSHEDSLR